MANEENNTALYKQNLEERVQVSQIKYKVLIVKVHWSVYMPKLSGVLQEITPSSIMHSEFEYGIISLYRYCRNTWKQRK
jgi:hypothetical protein